MTATFNWRRWVAVATLAGALIMWDIDWGRDSGGCSKVHTNSVVTEIFVR